MSRYIVKVSTGPWKYYCIAVIETDGRENVAVISPRGAGVRKIHRKVDEVFIGKANEGMKILKHYVRLTDRINRMKGNPVSRRCPRVQSLLSVRPPPRKQSPLYAAAQKCVQIRDQFGISTPAQITRHLSRTQEISRQHVSNLLRLWDGLCDVVKEEWKNGHPKATFKNLVAVKGFDKEQQPEEWLQITSREV